jgi:hypothetical protein
VSRYCEYHQSARCSCACAVCGRIMCPGCEAPADEDRDSCVVPEDDDEAIETVATTTTEVR